jgi:hypothetical protein
MLDQPVEHWPLALVVLCGVVVLLASIVPPWREKLRGWLTTEVRQPRIVPIVTVARDLFAIMGTVIVVVLWYRDVTSDEAADRNARAQSCASEYAAVTAAWQAREELLSDRAESYDRRAETLFASAVVASQVSDAPIDQMILSEYQEATEQAEDTTVQVERVAERVDTMARLRIGLAQYVAVSVDEGDDFVCPVLPDDLKVEAIPVG